MRVVKLISKAPFMCPNCRNIAANEYDDFDNSSYSAKVITGLVLIFGGIAAGFLFCLFWLLPIVGIVLLASTSGKSVHVRHCAACNYRW